MIIEKDCDNSKFSSNINEVIKAVLNSLFFLRKDFAHTKSTKSTKRHKYTRAKAQNANKRISDYFPLRCFLGAFFYFCLLASVLCFFVVTKFLNKEV